MVEKKTLHSNTFLKSLADNFEKKNHQESAILALKFKFFSYLKKIRNLNFGAENKYKKAFFKGLIFGAKIQTFPYFKKNRI